MAGGPARIARHQDIHGRGAREALATAVPTALLRLGGQVDRAVAQAAQGGEGAMPSFVVDEGIPIEDLAYELPDDDGVWLVGGTFGWNVPKPVTTVRNLIVALFAGSWGSFTQKGVWVDAGGSGFTSVGFSFPPVPVSNEILTAECSAEIGPEPSLGGSTGGGFVTILYGYRIGNA